MVHVALAGRGRQRVDLLLHLQHVQRRDTQDLGLAALEDRGAVHARDDLDLGIQRTDVRQTAAVDAHTLGEDAAAHDQLRDRLVRATELGQRALGQLARLDGGDQLRLDVVLDGVVGVLTLDLVGDLVHRHEAVVRATGDEVVGLLRVGREDRVGLDLLGRRVRDDVLRRDELLDEGLGGLQSLRDDLLAGLDGAGLDEVPAVLGGLGLDHHDRDVAVLQDATGDHQVEHGLLDLRGRRERDPLVGVLAVARDEREADTGDGAGEGQTGDLRRQGCRVDRQRVVELARGDAQDGHDDLDLVAQAVDERRTQRAVDQAADEDRLGGGPTLATEERTGDLASGVRTLFDVDGQREEVEALTRVLARARGRQQHGLFVEVGGNGTLCLLRQSSGLEPDRAGAESAVVENGFGGGDFWTFQEVSPSLFRLARAFSRTRSCEGAGTGRSRRAAAPRAAPPGRSALATSRKPPFASDLIEREPTTGDQLPAGLLRMPRKIHGNLLNPISRTSACVWLTV